MAAPVKGRKKPLLIGLVVLALFSALVVMAINATSGLPGQDKTMVRVAFADVGGLRVDDDVRIARVRVGRVAAVGLDNGVTTVTLQIDEDRAIYRDARASLDDRSALGQKFVDLDPGTPAAGELGQDAVIPVSRTASSQNLGDLFEVFDPDTRQALGSTLRETGNGAAGHTGDLRDILRSAPEMLPNLGTVSQSLAANDGRYLSGLLSSADTLAARFSGRQAQLARLLGQLDTTVSALGVDNGQALAGTLDRAPGTLRSARDALAQVQTPLQDVRAAMTTLRPGAEALGEATPDLRGVLREGVQPLNKVPGVAEQADPALRELTQTVADARPLAPRATRALASANPFVSVLAPYAPEIGLFFDNWASALARGDEGGRYLRVTLMLGTESLDGQLDIKDPSVSRNAYPAPGQAGRDRQTGLSPVKGR